MPRPVAVRPAVIDDADAICDVHVASWRVGYRHIYPDELLDADDFESSRRDMWHSWEHSPTRDRRLAVAELHGAVVGFALSGDTDDPDGGDHEGLGELLSLYVHPDAWGSPAATALMHDALHHMRGLDHQHAVLWTLTASGRARSFYERSGWRPTGRSDTWDRYPTHPVDEIEYTIDLRRGLKLKSS